ncbi:MAG: hypothetical protein IPP25_20280 [Saprospiraceae bacterium]|nr:hypothetical protein [Candidatus Opimibacter skivensis]
MKSHISIFFFIPDQFIKKEQEQGEESIHTPIHNAHKRHGGRRRNMMEVRHQMPTIDLSSTA